MTYSALIRRSTVLAFLAGAHMWSQEPAANANRASRAGAPDRGEGAAIAGSKQDPAAVARGVKVFGTYCAGCHGVAAKGGPGAPDLVRSLLVLDDEKGILIAPVIREGRPDKGMPKLGLTEPQIADVVAWLHVRTYAAGHRGTYTFGDVLTGDAKQGAVYFNGAGQCSTCHSPMGDLAGIGKKYDPFSLQGRWLQPRGSGRGSGGPATSGSPTTASGAPTVKVTLPSGGSVSGVLDHIDDFALSLRDSAGKFHSFARDQADLKIEIHDPLKAHTELLRHYTDADIHNVTAYLNTLK